MGSSGKGWWGQRGRGGGVKGVWGGKVRRWWG